MSCSLSSWGAATHTLAPRTLYPGRDIPLTSFTSYSEGSPLLGPQVNYPPWSSAVACEPLAPTDRFALQAPCSSSQVPMGDSAGTQEAQECIYAKDGLRANGQRSGAGRPRGRVWLGGQDSSRSRGSQAPVTIWATGDTAELALTPGETEN